MTDQFYNKITKICDLDPNDSYIITLKPYLENFFKNPTTKNCYNIFYDHDYFVFGLYNHYVKKNNENVKKYYTKSIKLNNNTYAMVKLASYYRDIEKDYDNAKYYFLMAILNNNSDAMVFLGDHYYHQEENFKEAIKYYLMAIKHNNFKCLTNLISYYENIEMNVDEANKYRILKML